MEGRGVTNYAVDKPSYAYSTATTEFDDELIKRGIITLEQAMLGKGASPEEAERLTRLATQTKKQETQKATESDADHASNSDNDSDKVDVDDSDFEDDDFLESYRQRRIKEMQEEHNNQGPRFGEVVPISRPEWMRQVNEASNQTFVVVNLTSSDVDRTGCVEAAVAELASKYPFIKFVNIAYQQAIPNWPHTNLPSIFVYRHGKMQHELIRMMPDTTTRQLESTLASLQVLETK